MAQTINAGKIQYGIGFQIDKTGLQQLENQLKQLSSISATQVQKINPNLSMNDAMSQMQKIKNAALEVQTAMKTAFNDKTGILNIEKFNKSLQSLNLQEIKQRFASAGETGRSAFLKISQAALTTSVQLKQTHTILDKMGQTLMNTLKWQISSSAINRFTGAIQQAYGYVQHLDTSLNDIRIVTGKSADEMERFARTANKAAKSLGASTTEYTEAALIYYQQGLSDEEANARAATTLKAANVTGQSGAAVSEELTAVWNGYKVSAEETELAVDKLAAVAATTAADLEELSVGMSKVASAANNMGVDMDQLNAMIATIVSITRQAPESVGTALKTIFARMSDLKLGDIDEDGLKLGDVSGSLEKVGISILDTNGDLREMGDVIEEVAGKWDTWTKAQQAAIAQSLAGKRQYNNLVALFDNWDMYSQALDTSKNSMGTLQKQQNIYMESTEAHLQVLQTQWEDLYDSILDTNTINSVVDGFTKIIKVITVAVDAMGGLKGLITGLGGLAMTVFSKQIAQSFTPFIQNKQIEQRNKEVLANIKANNELQAKQGVFTNEAAQIMNKTQSDMAKYWKFMSAEEFNANQETVRELGLWTEKQQAIKDTKKEVEEYFNKYNKQSNQNNSQLFITGSSQNLNSLKFLDKQSEASKILKKDVSELETKIRNVNDKYSLFRDNIKNSKGAFKFDNFKKALDDITVKLNGTQTRIQQLKNEGLIDEKKANEAEAVIEKIRQRIEKLQDKNFVKNKNSVGFTQDIIDDFEKLNSIMPLTEAQIIQYKEALLKAGLSEEEADLKVKQLTIDLDEQRYKSEALVEAWSKLAGGVSSVVFSFNSFTNLFDTLSNPDLSFGEKIQQSLTGVAMSIPMLMNGFKNLKESAATFSSSASKGLKILGDGLSKLTSGFGIAAMAAVVAGVAIYKIVSNDYQREQERIARADAEAAKAAEEHTKAVDEQVSKIDELVKKYDELNEKIKNQETTTESARNEIYNLCKQYGLQDLALKALVADYDELGNVIDEAQAKRKEEQLQASKEEKDSKKRSLRSSIWKGLSASQRDNNEIINGRTVSQTIDLSDMGDFERNVTTARSEFYSGLTNLGIEVGDWGHIDINALADVYAKNREGLLDLINNSNVDAAAELRDIIDKNIEHFDKYREIYQSERNLEAENKFATTFKDNIDSINSITSFNQTVQTLVRSLTTQDENGVRLFDSETEAEDFVRNYLNGIDKIKEYAKQSDISSALISGGSKFSEKEIAEQVGKRSSSAIQFLSNNIISANAYDNLDDFFDEYEKRIKYENTKNNRITVNVALNEASSGKEFDEDTLNNLFDNTDLEKEIGISKEDFANKSSKEQKQILIDYYLTAVQEEKHYQEIKKEGLNEEEKIRKNNLEEGLHELQALEDKYAEQNIGFTLMSADSAPKGFVDKIQKDFEYLKDATIVDIPVDITFDTEEGIEKYKEFLNKVKEENPGIGFDIDSMLGDADKLENINKAQEEYQALLKQYPDLYKEGQNSINDLIAELENLNLKETESKTIFEKTDYLPALNATKAAIKDLNSEVDNLQSTYQTLQNVVEDYNEDGALTLDNLQALMEMDSLYVATLELENGQLTLNENTYRSIMDAKLQEMRISAAEQFLIELGVIATDAASQANLKFADTSHQASGAIQGVIDKCKEGVNAVTAYAMSLAGVTADAETVKVSAQAFYNRMQFVDELASQPISSILGKGGSSSGSGKEAQHEEYLEREYDIYRKINTELDQIGNKLDRINEIESHSWGVSYLDALQEENKLLDEQLEKLEEKKALQIGDLGQRKKQLENEGFTFNENGSLITNAEDRLDALYASYNTNYVDKYNSMSADAQEEFEAEMKAEEDRIKQIEDAVGDYEKLYGDYEDLIKELQDLYYKQIEKDVEEFNFEIDLELELSDARKEWKDFWHDVVKDVKSDDFVGQIAKSFSKLGELIGVGGSSNNDVLGLTQHLKETLDEVNTQITTHGLDGLFGTDTKLSEENLTNYRDKLMSALKDAKEEIDNISDNYLSMLESAQDMIDKQVEGWEHIGDQINHDVELIKLISGDKAYDALEKQYELQHKNNLETIEAQRIGRDYWKQRMEYFQKMIDTAEEGSKEQETYQEGLKTSTEKFIEANERFNESVEKSIKDVQTLRENEVNAIMDSLDKAMSGGVGMDLMEKEWQLMNDYADNYFDNIERALNMEEYAQTLNDAANATGLSAKNQEKLNQFRDDELKKLNEKERLTQYDIDESKARLEILKQELAMEDAAQNKSKMRLRRDSQGNYTYQYIGDEKAVEDAEKRGITARKEWYELVKKRNKEVYDYKMQLDKEYYDLVKQRDEAALAGDQERVNELNKLIQSNREEWARWDDETIKANRDIIDGTAKYFADIEHDDIIPNWNTTVVEMAQKFGGDNKDSYLSICQNAITELDAAQKRYEDRTKEVLNQAGIDYQNLVDNGIDPTRDAIKELNESNEDLADNLDENNEKLEEMRGYLEECAQAYRDFKDDAVSAIQEANQALETLARTHMDTVNQINATPINSAAYAPATQGNLGYNDNNGGSTGGGNDSDNTTKNPLDYFPAYNPNKPSGITGQGSEIQVEAGSGRIMATSNNTSPSQVQNSLNTVMRNYFGNGDGMGFSYHNGYYWVENQAGASNLKHMVEQSKKFKLLNIGQKGFYIGTKGNVSFKSGGYTGDWSGQGVDGMGGRMAVLHQKELVLNESDTSNMLAAVEALRQMNIDKLAQSILATSIATAQMQIQTQLLSAQLSGLRDQYESSRNTTINADFSGVRTADEILRAFEELENYGLQQYNTGDASYRSY